MQALSVFLAAIACDQATGYDSRLLIRARRRHDWQTGIDYLKLIDTQASAISAAGSQVQAHDPSSQLHVHAPLQPSFGESPAENQHHRPHHHHHHHHQLPEAAATLSPLAVDYHTAMTDAGKALIRRSPRRGPSPKLPSSRRSRGRDELRAAAVQFWTAWRTAFQVEDARGRVAMLAAAAAAGLLLPLAYQPSAGTNLSTPTLDLHGMSVPMATGVVHLALVELRDGPCRATTSPGRGLLPEKVATGAGLLVVTGRGRHSVGGEARVRTAVLEVRPLLLSNHSNLKDKDQTEIRHRL